MEKLRSKSSPGTEGSAQPERVPEKSAQKTCDFQTWLAGYRRQLDRICKIQSGVPDGEQAQEPFTS